MMVRILLLCITLAVVSGHVSAQSRSMSWLKGTWTGTGYQIDNDETWTMRLRVTGNRYSVEYPSLNCGGVWKLISIGRYSATFRERITDNKVDCTDRGHVTIERLNRDQIDFRYRNPGASEFIASGILKRQMR